MLVGEIREEYQEALQKLQENEFYAAKTLNQIYSYHQ